jgi:predicted nuclease of predicted toxin-antitoxin system
MMYRSTNQILWLGSQNLNNTNVVSLCLSTVEIQRKKNERKMKEK